MRFWRPLRKRVQKELMKRGFCVGCTRSLSTAERVPYPGEENWEFVLCRCGRIFVYDKLINSYRRAEFKEVKDINFAGQLSDPASAKRKKKKEKEKK